jgi:hypothetical protein
MSLENKAKEFFASNPGAENLFGTTDGSIFEDHNFADAHSQRLDNPEIKVFSRNENFKELKQQLFFEGSKWIFHLITDAIEHAIEKKRKKRPATENKNIND